jgi:CYTH domain-containing protein
MIRQDDTTPGEPIREGKYARVERERRFLLAGPPPASTVVARYRITDWYLVGTRLRLRRVERPDSGACEFKLTQKVPVDRPGHVQGLITNIYLSPAEYDLLASLPAAVLSKTRLSVPPLGIDIFDPPLHGLVMAEAEFTTDEAARSFLPPQETVAEVTEDARFTGGRLVRTHRHELLTWLTGYGIKPVPTRPAGQVSS